MKNNENVLWSVLITNTAARMMNTSGRAWTANSLLLLPLTSPIPLHYAHYIDSEDVASTGRQLCTLQICELAPNFTKVWRGEFVARDCWFGVVVGA